LSFSRGFCLHKLTKDIIRNGKKYPKARNEENPSAVFPKERKKQDVH
jgi:hypothetical protein